MQVGIFAEGRGDLAVITNILKGAIGVDRSDMRYQLPEFEKDQTDLSVMPAEQHSNWTLVKEVCVNREKINKFFDSPIEQQQFIVIQIDTAERHLEGYDVTEPIKNTHTDFKEYSRHLRSNMINKMNEWLEHGYQNQVVYAITVEETDAWVLAIYHNGKTDTSSYHDPKKRLNDELNRVLKNKEKNILKAKAFEKYDQLSSDFRKKKKLLVCANRNESLKLFCESLNSFKLRDDISATS